MTDDAESLSDPRSSVREFLTARRARLSPEQVGLTPGERTRRVPGLRREEVAMLAGISVEYYVRLERGNLAGVSGQVLDALSEALRLDALEHRYLHELASAFTDSGGRRSGPGSRAHKHLTRIPPSLELALAALTGTPAAVRNDRLDLLAVNPLARALYAPVFAQADRDGRVASTARFTFLDPAAGPYWADHARAARDVVGTLRLQATRNPQDDGLQEIVGELSTRSEQFRRLWARHDVHEHTGGRKRINHPVVGPLELDFDRFAAMRTPGLTLLVYTAPPGSPSADALRLLASWAASEAAAPSSSSATAPDPAVS
ncbi:helix-turn-helix domain-containing protein [Salana multivorans]